MSASFRDPFDPLASLTRGCSCGQHASQVEHDRGVDTSLETEDLAARMIETAVVKAVFGSDVARRTFLRTFGAGTALAACRSSSRSDWLRKPPRRRRVRIKGNVNYAQIA